MKLISIGILLLTTTLASAKIGLQQIGDEFKRPIWLTTPAHTSDKLFIVEQAGRVLIVDQNTGKTLPTPFLDIRSQVSRKGNEEGLLSIAFSPDYITTGRLYAYFTNHEKTTEIVRFTATHPTTDLTCDPATKEILLTFQQPYRNHNGAYMEFGTDGYLYLGTGDGGSANDPQNNAQDLTNLLGKILRIDVSPNSGYDIPSDNPFKQPEGCPEIFAYGLRNPWRCSWDADLFYIADVGQNKWEEVNIVNLQELNGANFGWRPREGLIQTPHKEAGGRPPKGAIKPKYVYEHGNQPNQGLSINGGYVYRCSVSELHGQYLYSDHVLSRVWSFEYKNGNIVNEQNLTQKLARPDGKDFKRLASFGQDADKEVYLIEMEAGMVWKIIQN